MVAITKPWADDSTTRREPTSGERSNGFECGAADPDLFNFMMWYQDRWFYQAAVDAAVSPDPDDQDVLTKIVNALILAAADTASSSVSAYNPIFPDTQTSDGKLAITGSTAQVVVDAGQTFIHRGSTLIDTDDYDLATERTFATVANKTYHLRWRYNSGTPAFALEDLAAAGYNPTSASEDNSAFDSTYDDMLVARVVTDGSNVPTVTTLKNKHTLTADVMLNGTFNNEAGGALGQNAAAWSFAHTLDWARTPTTKTFNPSWFEYNDNNHDNDFALFESPWPGSVAQSPVIPLTRYALNAQVLMDETTMLSMHLTARA